MDRHVDDEYDRGRREDRSDGIAGLVDGLTSGKLLGDTLNRVVDASERMTRVQQSAFSALGLPSGSQFDSVVTRIRTIFHRLEELEDDIDRLERRVAELESRPRSAATPTPPRPKTAPRRASESKPRMNSAAKPRKASK